MDKNFELLSILLEENRKPKENISMFFLSGYFHAMFELNQEKWENELDKLTKDEFYKKFVWFLRQ